MQHATHGGPIRRIGEVRSSPGAHDRLNRLTVPRHSLRCGVRVPFALFAMQS